MKIIFTDEVFSKNSTIYKKNITMATSKPRKPFKFQIPGLIKWESEEWTVKETALIMGLIMGLIMIFIIVVIVLLKVYVLPVWGGSLALSQIGIGLTKIFKSRSP